MEAVSAKALILGLSLSRRTRIKTSLLNNLHDLVKQMGTKDLVTNKKSLKEKRAHKLYQYLKKTNKPSPEGEAAILNCTVNGTVHQRTRHHLEYILANNHTALQSGEMTSNKLADVSKYAWKLIAIARKQTYHPESTLIVPFLEEAFVLAEKAGLVLAAKTSSELLAILSAHVYFDETKYLYYREKADYFRRVNLLLQKGIISYREAACRHRTGEDRSVVVEVIKKSLEEVLNRPKELDHLSLTLLEFQLRIKITEIYEVPDIMIELATQALRYLAENDKTYPERRLAYYMYLGHAYLLRNNYNSGAALIGDLLEQLDFTSHNYGKLAEIRVLLCLRTGHYKEAGPALRTLQDWVANNDSPEAFVLSTTLFRAYLWLLWLLGAIPSVKMTKSTLSKKIVQELGGIRHSNNDTEKSHYHVISLIKNLCLRKYSNAREQWWALPKPVKSTGLRYKYFHALLSTVFEQDFHRTAVERHAKKHLGKLKAKALAGEATASMNEIIPFEQLWQLLIGQLQNKRTKLR